jgi:hypothetical protein
MSGVEYSKNEEKIYINDEHQYFDNTPFKVWEFRIGDRYRPLYGWFKNRKDRVLGSKDIAHFKKIANALYLTNRIRADVNRTLI